MVKKIYSSLLSLGRDKLRKALILGAVVGLSSTLSYAQLSGTKTINPSGSGANNYTTFQAAVTALSSQGVNGPVTFIVSAGTYNERIEIPNINGASATNTITFEGGEGNAATRVLQTSATSTTDAHTLRFNNSRWIRFRNITIQNNGTAAGMGVHFFNGSNDIILKKCRIIVNSTSTSTAFKAISTVNTTLVTDGTGCDNRASSGLFNIFIDSNYISGGYFGIFLTSSYNVTTIPYYFFITNNTIEDSYYYGIGAANAPCYLIEGNYIKMKTGNPNSYGFYHCNGSTSGDRIYNISRNIWENCGYSAIQWQTNNPSTNPNIPHIVSNNWVKPTFTSTSPIGIYLNFTRNTKVYNNTVLMNQPNGTAISMGAQSNYQSNHIKNNIMMLLANNSTGLCFEAAAGSSDSLDYNIYFKNNPAQNFVIIRANGSDFLKTNFKGGNNLNFNSYYEDPLIVNNLTDPRPQNICLKGQQLQFIDKDVLGNNRSVPPQIGAAEPANGLSIDAGIVSIIEPAVYPVIAGTQNAKVAIKNAGVNTLTSVNVNFQVGNTITTVNHTLSMVSCEIDTVEFSGVNQITLNPGTNNIKVWVSNPNNSTDGYAGNDTITATYCTPLPAGTYTVDAAGSGPNNYTTISALVDIMNCGGIAGPIDINIAPGTYTEQVSLSYVRGVSATNYIRFNGSGNTSTTIQMPANITGNASLFEMVGTSHVKIENIRFRSNPLSNSALIRIAGISDSIYIANNDLAFNFSTTLTCFNITFGAATTGSGGYESKGTIIENNRMEFGYGGVNSRSSSLVSNTSNITVFNNIFRNHYYSAFYGNYSSNMIIDKNDIQMLANNVSYPIYLAYGNNIKVTRNNIRNIGNTGIYMFAGSNYELINNMLTDFNNTNASTQGIFSNSTNTTKVWHNTIIFNPQTLSTTGTLAAINHNFANGADYKNNILVYKGTNTRPVLFYKTPVSGFLPNINYNIYSTDNGNYYTENFTSYQNSLSNWRTFDPANNVNSIVDNPIFVSNSDAHLSPLYDAPTGDRTLGVLTDIDGDVRCSFAPTIGADENKFPNPAPLASFAAPDTVYENSPAKFIHTTVGDPSKMEFSWLVDGVFQSIGQTFTFTPGGVGTFQVGMIARNCFGADTAYKTINVISPSSTPVSDFVANKLVVNMFELIELTDISKFGPTQWQWSANPAADVSFTDEFSPTTLVTFVAPGLYEICLSTSNANGQGKDSCKKAYILVRDDAQMCNFTSTNATEGRLTDENGNLNYSAPAKNCSFLIDPCASLVNLKFNFFEVADANDILRVYDGTSTSAPLLGQFTLGSGLPGGSNGLTATSGKMFVTWTTNASGFARGFEANWTSVPNGTPAPIADFTFPTTIYTGQSPEFISTSTGTDLSYDWDFEYPNFAGGINGGNVDRDRYEYLTAGTYQVRLTVTNCGGTSTIIKNVNVIDPTSAPIVGFTQDKSRIPVLSTVKFTDTSSMGPLTWRWSISPANTSIFLNGNTSQNPEVRFFIPGIYDVKLVATNSFGQDSIVKTSSVTVYDYCLPAVANINADLGISRVAFKNIDNSSPIGQSSYTSYVNSLPAQSFGIGEVFNLLVERNTTTDRMSRKVWIDWNIDGDFDDAGELAAFQPSTKDKSFNTAIYVPRTAVAGITRMRIGTSYDNDNNIPCGINSVGEFEDYALEIIVDTEAPVITLLGSDTVYVEQWYSYVEPGFSVQDNVDGNITSWSTITSNFDSSFVGTYFVTYNVADSANNTSSKIRTVIVTDDVTPPVISLLGPSVDKVTVNNAYLDSGAIAIDYFNRNISANIVFDNSNVDISQLGTYQITYSITDGGGNQAQIARTLNVVDDLAPVITLNGNDTVFVEVKSQYADLGAVATDNFDQNVNVIASPATINTSNTGTQFVTYSATDASGNSAQSVTRTVIIRDTQLPVISLLGLDTVIVDVYSDYTEKGTKVVDNYCNALVAEADIYPNTNVLGTYEITYSVVDCEGNIAIPVKRIVRVVDRVAPILQLRGVTSTNVIQRWQPYTDAGYYISDNYYSEAELADSVKVTTNFRNDLEGDYEYCYDVVDPSGNRAQRVCRSIKVVANTTSVDKIEFGGTLTVYPVPTKGSLTLNLYLENEMNMDIVITNMLGQTVQNVYNGPVHQSEIKTDLSNLPAGMYFVRFTANGISTVRKIQVIN